MVFKEVNKDLFTTSDDYALAHCISADFALGAGIAKEFDKNFCCRDHLFSIFKASWTPRWDKTKERFRGGSVVIFDTRTIFNLVTKRNYYDKPTLTTINNALIWMKEQCEMLNINKVAMPRIGCGLDRQKWSDVKALIEAVFSDTDIEILVCSL